MATTLDAGVVLLYYSSTDDIDTAKSVVCESDSSFDGTRTTNSEDTKCGILKSLGHQDNKISGSAVTNLEPGPSEGSFNDLLNLYANGTKQFIWYRDPDDNIFIKGAGWFNQIGSQNKSSDFSRFTYTLEIDGDITTVNIPASFDTTFVFDADATPAPAGGIGATALVTDAEQKFEFNLIAPTTGLPARMDIFVSAVAELVIDFPIDYLTQNQTFRYTDKAGVEHIGTFVNGNRNF